MRGKYITIVNVLLSIIVVMIGMFNGERRIFADDLPEFVIEDGVLVKYNGPGGNVIIPDGVTEIGRDVFNYRWDVESVNIPNGVTTIGDEAFSWCSNLTNVDIPSGVNSIGYATFSGCSSLTSISIPSSVTNIGDYAFCDCNNLSKITVTSSNTVYDSRNNCNAIIETATNTLILGCANTTIPDSVVDIRQSAFYECTGLTSITIPKNIKRMGVGLFGHCENLKDVYYMGSEEEWNDIVSYGPGMTESYGGNAVFFDMCGAQKENLKLHYNHEHSLVIDVAAVTPTCADAGHTEDSHCGECGVLINKQKTLKALGHNYDKGTIIEEPTYEKQGKRVYTCLRCDNKKTESIAMLALFKTSVKTANTTNGIEISWKKTNINDYLYKLNGRSVITEDNCKQFMRQNKQSRIVLTDLSECSVYNVDYLL